MLLGYAKSLVRISQRSQTTLFVNIPKTHQIVTLIRFAALRTICHISNFCFSRLRLSVKCYALRMDLWWMATNLMKVEMTQTESTTITGGEKYDIYQYAAGF